ncbi:MAG: hypothetical protein AAF602_03870 [Myxococcota bacterium]
MSWWSRLVRGWPHAAWEMVVDGQHVELRVYRRSACLYVDGRLASRSRRDPHVPIVTLRAALQSAKLVPPPPEIEAQVAEVEGTVHGAIRRGAMLLAGSPIPPPRTELAALVAKARRRLTALADAGIHTPTVDRLEQSLEAASRLPALLHETAELEVWATTRD